MTHHQPHHFKSHGHKQDLKHDHKHDHRTQQIGALRVALEHAGRSVQAAESALERTKAELLSERHRRAQMTEQCARALEALQDMRNENKRLRSLIGEKTTELPPATPSAPAMPGPSMPLSLPQKAAPIPAPPAFISMVPVLDELNAIEVCPTERVIRRP